MKQVLVVVMLLVVVLFGCGREEIAVEKPEKIYDFGELGKYSETTLSCMDRDYIGYVVVYPQIKVIFDVKFKEITDELTKLDTLNFYSLSEFYGQYERYKSLRERLDKLLLDYNKTTAKAQSPFYWEEG